jgi:hypothetical protein
MTLFDALDLLNKTDLRDGLSVGDSERYYERRDRIILKSGLSMSIQSHAGSYCFPRQGGLPSHKYTSFEIGYPNEPVADLSYYAEDLDDPCGTIYPYVPLNIIQSIYDSNGGINRTLGLTLIKKKKLWDSIHKASKKYIF